VASRPKLLSVQHKSSLPASPSTLTLSVSLCSNSCARLPRRYVHASLPTTQHVFFFFFFTLVTGPRRSMSLKLGARICLRSLPSPNPSTLRPLACREQTHTGQPTTVFASNPNHATRSEGMGTKSSRTCTSVVCERNRDPSKTTTPAGGLGLCSCWSRNQ